MLQTTLYFSIQSLPVVGKIKSRFDLNRDFRHIVIRFRSQKIRFDCLRLEIWFDLLFLEIRFGSKWFGYESRSSPGTAEWLDMPRSIFSKSTASSRASLHASVGHLQWRGQLVPHETGQTRQSSSFLGITIGRKTPYPTCLAKRYLSAPATSASVERLFPVARAII